MRRWTATGAVAVVVLLAACGTGGGPTPAPTTSSATPTPSDVPSEVPAAAAPSVDDVRAAGVALADAVPDAGALLTAAGAAAEPTDAGDGSARTSVTGPAGTLAWVAPPAGGSTQVQADGSVTLHDAAGTVVAALGASAGADGARAAWRAEGDVLALDAPGGSASFTVGVRALESLTWGEAEGGRSLAVVPAAWARGGGLAAQRAVASQLTALEPEAASASMQAQLWCHVLGAPDKTSWNLEPWRPDVPTTTLLATRCNPTEADL